MRMLLWAQRGKERVEAYKVPTAEMVQGDHVWTSILQLVR